jgi:hypothetical protein
MITTLRPRRTTIVVTNDRIQVTRAALFALQKTGRFFYYRSGPVWYDPSVPGFVECTEDTLRQLLQQLLDYQRLGRDENYALTVTPCPMPEYLPRRVMNYHEDGPYGFILPNPDPSEES